MDISAIIDEFNRRKAQAGQSVNGLFNSQPVRNVADTLGLQKKPANWFQQMQQGQNAVINPQQRDNINRELADMLERFTAGVVPEPIRARGRAMQTDPSAATKPFTSEEVKGITPFVTAAAPIAYHGTPHTFDKFDASKIGTGQGAQTYGHGLYFAENPQVAQSYMTELSGKLPTGFSDKYPESARGYIRGVIGDVASGKLTPENAAKYTQHANINMRGYPVEKLAPEIAEGAKLVKGSVCQVNIPDQHAARMLDWDKPLSEQPGIVKAVQDVLPGVPIAQRLKSTDTGEQLYKLISENMAGLGGKENASKALADAGIPGIKYLDQGSRGKIPLMSVKAWMEKSGITESEARQELGQTRNFVVFDPAILQDVTRK